MGSENRRDYIFHLEQARKFKEDGNFALYRKELELARRDGVKDKDTLIELFNIYIEEGKIRNAKKLLKSLLLEYPDDLTLKEKAKEFIEDSGIVNEFRDLLKEDFLKDEEVVIPDKVVLRFLELFQGREGVYARMWKGSDSKISYSPVKEPFNMNVARNHLLGNITVGVYPVRIDNTVLFSVFDVDVKKEFMEEAIEYGDTYKKLKKKALSTAEAIKEVISIYGLRSYIEDSGFKGYHVWVFFEEPLLAHYARLFMKNVLKGVDRIPPEIRIEIIPKQSKVKEGRFGSLIKLPGSFHLKTGVISYFIGCNKTKEDFFEFLMKIKRNPKHLVEAVVSQIRDRELMKEDDVESFDLFELSYLRSKCPVLDFLIEKAEREEPLNRDERLVLIYTVGHLENGPEIVNYLLKKYIERGDVEPLKKKLKGYPTSCPKIRKKLRHITAEVQCSCVFEDEGMYPNPLLHLKGIKKDELKAFEVKPLLSDFERYVERYIEIGKRIDELIIEKERIEEYFNSHFDKAGVDTLELRSGKLKRVLHPNGKYKFYYELG